MSSTAQQAALEYLHRAWQPIPIPRGTKNPNRPGWQNERQNEETARRTFQTGCNIGVLLGRPSGGLVDIDLDHPVAVKLAPNFLPPTSARFGRAEKPLSHWVYKAVGDLPTRKWKTFAKETIVEYRSTGAQTVFPPSIHPSGEQIAWADSGEPARVPAAALVEAVDRLALAVRAAIGDSLDRKIPEQCFTPVRPIDASDVLVRAIKYLANPVLFGSH